jgi:hypothetical protein
MNEARLRVISTGGMSSEVHVRSGVSDTYLCFSRRGNLIVKVGLLMNILLMLI